MATIYWTPLLFKVGNWQCTGKINRAMGKNSLRMVLYHVLMKHSISIRLMCQKKSLFISDVHNNYGSQKIWTLVEWKKNNILYYYSIWIKSFYLCINSAVCGVHVYRAQKANPTNVVYTMKCYTGLWAKLFLQKLQITMIY